MDETDEELVEWALSIEAGLSTWEMDFIEDMKKLVDADTKLSPGRRSKLEEIVKNKG